MSTEFDPNKKDKKIEGSDGLTEITNPGVVGPPSSVSPPGAAPVQTQSQGAGTSSGRFGNITNYIKANQNFNKEGGGLAGKVASNIQNQGDEVTKNVASAVNAFKDQATGQVKQAQEGATLAAKVAEDPTAFIKNSDNVNKIKNVVNSDYTGPKSLADLEGKQSQAVLQSQANALESNVNAGQTEKGRYSLLRNMFNKPNYTSGQQNLDNLIIQGNKDQLKTLQNTRNISGQVNQNLNQNTEATSKLGLQSIGDFAAAKKQAVGTLTDRTVKENDEITKSYNDYITQAAKQYNDAKIAAQGGTLSEDLARKAGLTTGSNLYGLSDLSRYVTRGEDPTLQQYASNTNYSNLSALKDLLGSAVDPKISGIFSNFSDATQAGTGNREAVGIQADELKNAIRDSSAEFQRQVNPIMQRISDAEKRLNTQTEMDKRYIGSSNPIEVQRALERQAYLKSLVDAEKASLNSLTAKNNFLNRHNSTLLPSQNPFGTGGTVAIDPKDR